MDKIVGVRDNYHNPVTAPILRQVIASGSELIPTADITVILGADVTVTIGGQSINLLQGTSFVMVKDVTYGFSASVQLGVS